MPYSYDLYISVISVILGSLAIYFAYRLTHVTGGFRAWWLIIGGLTLIMIRRVIVTLVSVEGSTYPGLIIGDVILMLSMALLLLGMYDLLQTFQKRSRLSVRIANRNKATTTQKHDADDEYIYTQATQLFQRLWQDTTLSTRAGSADSDSGLSGKDSSILSSREEIFREAIRLLRSPASDVLIHFAKESRLPESLDILRTLSEMAPEGGKNIRIMTPEVYKEMFAPMNGIEWRRVEELKVSLIIIDKKEMLLIYYNDQRGGQESKHEEGEEPFPYPSAILTTNKFAVLGVAFVFQSLWDESELREREEKSRRQAELMQDILTHDIRNYNQVSKLSAELLKESLKDDKESQTLLDSLLEGIDGSIALVERGKTLGKIVSDGKPQLCNVDLFSVIEGSMHLMGHSNPNKSIIEANNFYSLNEKGPIEVLADDLLGEVFTNVFSNSVKYTDGDKVPIEVLLERVQEMGGNKDGTESRQFWKVSILDRGRGIPEEKISKLFSRYHESAKGTGLGLAIVHALVVGRYNGRVEIANRKDNQSGTVVRIWLPAAVEEKEKARVAAPARLQG